MHALQRWALALALLLSAGASAAMTICHCRGDYYYGDQVISSLAAEANRSIAGSIPRSITGMRNLQSFCTGLQAPTEKYYCESAPRSAGDDIFAPQISYGKVITGLTLNPPEKTNIRQFSGSPNVIGDLYNIKYIQEIWEIQSDAFGRGAPPRKLEQYSGLDEFFATCWETRSVIAYLNEVFTTAESAKASLDAIAAQFGTGSNKSIIEYRLLYNQTACKDDGKISCLGDLAETFEQRQELANESLRNRWEYFWILLSGQSANHAPKTGNLIGNIGEIIEAAGSAIINKVLELTTSLAQKRTLDEDLQNQLKALEKNSRSHPSTVIIAHSQGNLFSNSIERKFPKNHGYSRLGFVHVAPPTSTLSGSYVLNENDAVIRGLATLMPGSTPNPNISIPYSSIDKTGHGFLETYFDSSRPAFEKIMGLIENPLYMY